MQLKPEELTRRLKEGTVDHLYLFTGDEPYFIEEAVSLVRSHALTGEEEKGNFHTLSGDDLDFDTLRALVQTIPLSGKNRLIVLKGPEKIKKGDADRLAQLLQKKQPSVRLILVAEKIDQRTRLGEVTQKEATAVHFYRLFEDRLPGWIVQKVRESGRTIPLPLAQVMAQMLGNDLYRIERELTKVYLYMGKDTQITRQHLVVVSGESRIFSVFDLVRNLGERNVEPALKILDKLMEEGTSQILLLAMIVRQFRQIYLARSLLEQGKGGTELNRALGLAPMFARQIAEQARFFSYQRLQELYGRLLETDLTLKSSSCHPRLILENLIIEMCQNSPDS
ncbi:MAG: DNA polymerase III subunit delta [bacterium]